MEYLITALLLFILYRIFKLHREVGVLKNDMSHIKRRLCGKRRGKEAT